MHVFKEGSRARSYDEHELCYSPRDYLPHLLTGYEPRRAVAVLSTRFSRAPADHPRLVTLFGLSVDWASLRRLAV